MSVNEYFNNFPIDFFKIEPTDFIGSQGFENGNDAITNLHERLENVTKENLILTEGYIGEDLDRKIDLKVKDTTVINCAVGQGKTTAILEILKKHFEEEPNCYFIIAVPIVSLIKQYYNDLINLGFVDTEIFNYENIDSDDESIVHPYSDPRRKIHLVTVNALLGNPGDKVALQAKAKNMYLTSFSNLLRTNNKKVVIIYDEIHEAIKNFSDLGLAHLFYFGDVIQKNIVISATFNVTSISVIKKLSTLTDEKIRILEAPRTVVKEQSKLFLHFNNYGYSANNYTIKSLIINLVNRNRNIDILCFSKRLAQSIIDSSNETGRILIEKFGSIRECTARLRNNQPVNEQEEDFNENKFDNDFCNVGTNFKSGVSIQKENHSFIIIFPPANSRRAYASESGIFTEGINSVIQSIARQRTAGEIHLVLPFPIEFDFESLPENMTVEQKQRFEQYYDPISTRVNTTTENTEVNNVRLKKNKYIPFSEHYNVVKERFGTLLTRLMLPFSINSDIPMPTIDEFTFSHAEKILNQVGFLGKDLASFITYCAFTNQFYNARLESYNINSPIDFQSIEEDIIEIYNSLEDTSDITQNFLEIEHQIFLGNINYGQTQNRLIRQNILKVVADKAENITHIPINFIPSTTRYFTSFFNNFVLQNDEENSLKTRLINFRERIMRNNFAKRGNEYFEKYEKSRIFNSEANEIRDIIQTIKSTVPPLNRQFSNFFRTMPTEDLEVEKVFYEFLLRTIAKTQLSQVTIESGQRESHHKILQRL